MMRHLFAAAACAAIFGLASHAGEAALADGEFYTQVNLWSENPKPIQSTNYHVGEQIPLGSRVTLVSANAKDITFKWNGRDFTIRIEIRHTKVGLEAVKDRTFGKTTPLESEAFKALTEEQQTAVKKGRVAVGMAKATVLMAYGYPPEHETPTTESNFWKYWRNRFITQSVTFDDGKVSAVAGF